MIARAPVLHRGLLIAGVVILVACPASAVLLSVEGSAYGLAELPSQAHIGEGGWGFYRPVCGPDPLEFSIECTRNDSSAPAGLVYVNQTGSIVIAFEGGPRGGNPGWSSQSGILVTHANQIGIGFSTYPACNVNDLYYPGFGSDTYSDCPTGTYGSSGPANDSIVVTDTFSYSQTTIPLGPGPGCWPDSFALNPQANLLYCTGNGTHLLTINLNTKSLVSQAPLAGFKNFTGAPLLYDNVTGDLLVGTWPVRALWEISPTTGDETRNLTLPGFPVQMGVEPGTSLAYVAFWNGTTVGPGMVGVGIAVLNLTTFTEVALASTTVPGPLEINSVLPMTFDAAHHEAYVSLNDYLVAIDTETHQMVPSPFPDGYWVGPPIYPVALAYDHANDTLTQAVCPFGFPLGYVPVGACGLAFDNLTHSPTAYGAFSAVPGVGVYFPLALGGIGFLIAVGTLIAYRVQSRRSIQK